MWRIDTAYEETEDTLITTNVAIHSKAWDSLIFLNKEKIRFRLKDADGNLYYSGWMTEVSFAPMDDYGQPNDGCTTLEYCENGNRWVEL